MGAAQSSKNHAEADKEKRKKLENVKKLYDEQNLRDEIAQLENLSYTLDVDSPTQSFINVVGKGQVNDKTGIDDIVYYEVGLEFIRNHSAITQNIHNYLNGEFLGLKMTPIAKNMLEKYQKSLQNGAITYAQFFKKLKMIHLFSDLCYDIIKKYGHVTNLPTDGIVEDIFNRDDIQDKEKYSEILIAFKKIRETEQQKLGKPPFTIELQHQQALWKHGERIEEFLYNHAQNWSSLETTVDHIYKNIMMKGYWVISMRPSSFEYTYEDDWYQKDTARASYLRYGTFSLEDIPCLVAQMERQIGRVLKHDNTEEALKIANKLINIVESYPTRDDHNKNNDHLIRAKDLVKTFNADIRKTDSYKNYKEHVDAYKAFMAKLRSLDEQIIEMVQMGEHEHDAIADKSEFKMDHRQYIKFYNYPIF